jgi:hypothetical protein
MAREAQAHHPEGMVRMTPMERHARWLLRCYPVAYRRERGEEIIDTLLEASNDRAWPQVRDVRALAVGGLKARAAQNRQHSAGANLRLAVMTGIAMYLSFRIAVYLAGVVQEFQPNSAPAPGWASLSAAVTALLVGGTVVLAWTAPRVAVLAGALAASAGVVSFALLIGGPVALLGPRLVQVFTLLALAALTPQAGKPSRHWLWLPGALVVSSLLLELGLGYGWLWLGFTGDFLTPGLPLLAMVVGGILWVGVDARLIVALLTYLAVTRLQVPVAEISSGLGILASLPFLLVVAAVAAPAVWLLRRQSARVIRAD